MSVLLITRSTRPSKEAKAHTPIVFSSLAVALELGSELTRNPEATTMLLTVLAAIWSIVSTEGEHRKRKKSEGLDVVAELSLSSPLNQ